MISRWARLLATLMALMCWASPAAQAAQGAASLTKADADAWLDSWLPGALAKGDIAGAAVVVVKDGEVLTERGFGRADARTGAPVDPARTVFRMGSVSKLFTWTAVMQLAEQRRLDLDADVNRYLDFKIPPYHGRPVTLRELMTHTAGFEEHMKQLFVPDRSRMQSLEAYVKAWTPARIYPPGEVPAYSNYGAGLAGYIVQRVSGEPFQAYVERHIFAPLAMTSSTFREPLPAALQARLAQTYRRASTGPEPFEWLNDFPAGGMSATADDIGRFMIVELDGGSFGAARILRPETIEQMQRPQNLPPRPFPTMGLGFIPTWRNGHPVTGHDGDLQFSKTVLYLLPRDRVGVFLALNSAGADHAAWRVRVELLHRLMDRYFPAPAPTRPVAIATALAHGREISGVYVNSRSSRSNFFSLRALRSQERASVGADGVVQVTGFETADDKPQRWIETAPYIWTSADGRSHLAAVRRNGRVTALASEDDVTSNLLPVPWWRSAGWSLPVIRWSLGVLAAMILLWPVEAMVRRSRNLRLPRRRRALDVTARLAAASAIGAASIFDNLVGRMAKVQTLGPGLDGQIHLAQALSLLTLIGAAAAIWGLVEALRDPQEGWWARFVNLAMTAALLVCGWFVLTLRLLGPGTGF
jgi:CubicO group peptidase (beta-lactamase class C family)